MISIIRRITSDMYRNKILLCSYLLAITSIYSQEVVNMSSAFLLSNSNQVNTDSSFYSEDSWTIPDHNGQLGASVDLAFYFGLDFSVFLRNQISINNIPFEVDREITDYEFTNHLEELFISVSLFDNLRLDTGRIAIVNGLSFGFNPVDFYKSTRDVTYKTFSTKQGLGSWMVKANTFFPVGEFNCSYAPEIDIDTTSWDSNISELLVTNDQHRLHFGGTFLGWGDFIPEVYLHYNGKWQGGIAGTWQKNSWILIGEASLKPVKANDTFVFTSDFDNSTSDNYDLSQLEYDEEVEELNLNSVVGISYIFPDLHSVSCEYAFKGEAYTSDQWTKFKRAKEIGYFSSDVNGESGYTALANMYIPGYMTQHYLYLTARGTDFLIKGFKPFISSEINLTDLSFNLGVDMSYRFATNFELWINYRKFGGSDGSEYGELPYDYTFEAGIHYTY